MLEEVGITKFYNENKNNNFKCTIKDKPEDFVVQEIVDSKVCSISPIIDLEKFKMAENIFNNLPKGLSKEERREIYKITNFHPFKKLITKDNDFSVIEDSRDIFVFTIMKYNFSSNSMISYLSKKLNVPENSIQIAGNKDKKAITFQEISVNCNFNSLLSLAVSLYKNNKNFNFPEYGYKKDFDEINLEIIKIFNDQILNEIEPNNCLMIYNIRRGHSKCLGDLEGNYFTIKINKKLDKLDHPQKFINYFGNQRFGNNLNNHIIGREIIDKNYSKVIDLIFKEVNYIDIKKVVEKFKFKKSLIKKRKEYVEHQMKLKARLDTLIKKIELNESYSEFMLICEQIEKQINDLNILILDLNDNINKNEYFIIPEFYKLSKLQKYIIDMKVNDNHDKYIVSSFSRMDKMIYLHAYQSYIFNEEASRRMENRKTNNGDKILVDNNFVDAGAENSFDDIYIPLKKMEDKLLKGGYRKLVENINDLNVEYYENSTIFKFFLNKSCYATMALRELIGEIDEVIQNSEN